MFMVTKIDLIMEANEHVTDTNGYTVDYKDLIWGFENYIKGE